MTNTLTLKAAKRVLTAAGYTDHEIIALIRGIKADAWDKGFHECLRDSIAMLDANPYRATQAASLDDRESRGDK